MEAVWHDGTGLRLAAPTVRLKVDDGPWFYGAESVIHCLQRLAAAEPTDQLLVERLVHLRFKGGKLEGGPAG